MNYLEIIGTLLGLVYLWLEYKASIYLWPVSIIMPAVYIFVYLEAGLYADFAISVYFLLASAYGWFYWKQHRETKVHHDKRKNLHAIEENPTEKEKRNQGIQPTPKEIIPTLSAIFTGAWLTIAFFLIRFTDSTVPWADSFTTALSMVGMWMLSRKFVEQWLVWMVVDTVSFGLYLYKDLYFTAVLYGIYAVIAVFGYIKWQKLLKKEYENH